ncbi:MAG: alpha/beta hydrolase [Bacteroidota bacterium]
MIYEHHGQSIAYDTIGSGQPVIWIHGFGEDRSMWPDFISDQFDGYTHYLIDLPGAGESPVWKGATIDQMAELVIGLIQSEELEKPVVIGHSMGGYVALAIGEHLQDQLGGLVLFHSHPYGDSDEKKQNRSKSAEFIRKHGTEVFIKELIPKLFPPAYANAHPDLLTELIEGAKHYPTEGLATAMEAMRDRPNRVGVFSKFSFPVCCIIGSEDTLLPGKPIDQSQWINHGMVRYHEGIGHMGMHEDQKATRKDVQVFLEYAASLI